MPLSWLPWQLLVLSMSWADVIWNSVFWWEPGQEENGGGYGFAVVFVCLTIFGLFI